MTLLFFPKGLEKKAAIAVDLLKPSYFPGNGIETAFFIPPSNLKRAKKQRSALLANRFLTHNGLVFGRKNSRRKIHRHLPRKRIKLQLCKWSTTTVKRKQLFSIWRKKTRKKIVNFCFQFDGFFSCLFFGVKNREKNRHLFTIWRILQYKKHEDNSSISIWRFFLYIFQSQFLNFCFRFDGFFS